MHVSGVGAVAPLLGTDNHHLAARLQVVQVLVEKRSRLVGLEVLENMGEHQGVERLGAEGLELVRQIGIEAEGAPANSGALQPPSTLPSLLVWTLIILGAIAIVVAALEI